MSTNIEMYDNETLKAATPTNFKITSISDDGDVVMNHQELDVTITTTGEQMEMRHFHDSDKGLIERSFCVRPDLCYRALNDMEYCEALQEHIEEDWGREVRDKDVYELAGILKECDKLESFIEDAKEHYDWSIDFGYQSNDDPLYAVNGIKN